MGVKQTEALKLARDVMKHTRNCLYQSLAQDDVVCDCGVTMARAAIREALAEQPAQQQEPVAWRVRWPKMGGGYQWIMNDAPLMAEHGFINEPLYTSPKSKPLTDEEIKIIWRDIDGSEGMLMRFAHAIEAAHGIKGDA